MSSEVLSTRYVHRNSDTVRVLTARDNNYKIARFIYYTTSSIFYILDGLEEVSEENMREVVKKWKKLLRNRLIARAKQLLKSQDTERLQYMSKFLEDTYNLEELLDILFRGYPVKLNISSNDTMTFHGTANEEPDIKVAYFNTFIDEFIIRQSQLLYDLHSHSQENLDRYNALILGVIRQQRIHIPGYETEDLVQEALVKILEVSRSLIRLQVWYWDKLRVLNLTSSEAYMYKVILNVFRDLRKAYFAQKRGEGNVVNMGFYDEGIIDKVSLDLWLSGQPANHMGLAWLRMVRGSGKIRGKNSEALGIGDSGEFPYEDSDDYS